MNFSCHICIVYFSRILRHVVQPPAPQALTIPIPILTNELNSDTDDNDTTVSVTVADGTNKNPHKDSTIPIVMPTLPVVRELISYVPTTRNLATRGHLIGIPYLGDKFDAEDQRLINSISIEPSKSQKLTRSRKFPNLFFISFRMICIREKTR